MTNKYQYTPKTLTREEVRQVAKAAVNAAEFARLTDDGPRLVGPVGGPWWLFRPKIKPAVFVIPENPWR